LKLKDLFLQILEEKEKSLKMFYTIDILIQEFAKKPKENEDVKNEDVINEEIYSFKNEGEVIIPGSDLENIQTLDDLVDYISDIKIEGKPIINELVEEIILAMAGVGEKAIEEIVNEGDRILVDIDYGSSKNDSIGFKLNKVSGSASISLTMKKNNKIIPGNFDINEFNKQVIYFRNSIVGE
jgi:hypothetical protein